MRAKIRNSDGSLPGVVDAAAFDNCEIETAADFAWKCIFPPSMVIIVPLGCWLVSLGNRNYTVLDDAGLARFQHGEG